MGVKVSVMLRRRNYASNGGGELCRFFFFKSSCNSKPLEIFKEKLIHFTSGPIIILLGQI